MARVAKAPKPKRRWFEKSNLLTSLVLVLPVLIFYEIGVLASDRMNGADFLTNNLIQLIGVRGLIWVQVGLAGVMIALAIYLRKKEEFRIGQIVPVLVESALYALAMGTVILYLMVEVLGINPQLAAGGGLGGPFQRLVMSAGAGFHEELVFRLVVLGGLTTALVKSKAVPKPWLAFVMALAVSSALFAIAHHIGPLGEPWKVGALVYRAIAGALLGVLFHFRGFAIAVYTHTLYDVYVLLQQP